MKATITARRPRPAALDGAPASPSCRVSRADLAAYVRARLGQRETARVSAHLECCRACRVAYLRLVGVDASPARG